jgi:hypothetical protein
MNIELIGINGSIEIARGANLTLTGLLKNTGNSLLTNLSLGIEGFPLTHYKIISSSSIARLEPNSTKPFSLYLEVPEYMGGGKNIIKLTAEALSGNAWGEYSKEISLVIVTEDKENALECLANAAKSIEELRSTGIAVTELGKMLEQAKKYYETMNYPEASNLCQEIAANAELAATLREQITSINSAYAGLGKNITEIEGLISLAQEAFDREDYALSSQRLDQAQILLSLKQKEVQQTLSYQASLIKENWGTIIPALIIIIIISAFISSSANLRNLSKRIKATELQKQKLKNWVKDTQKKYFVDKTISARMYERQMAHHRSTLAEIEKKKSKLEMKKLGIISGRAAHDLEKTKNDIENAKKELQRKYFVEKVIDRKTFQSLLLGYDKTLQSIDRKIAMKKKQQ